MNKLSERFWRRLDGLSNYLADIFDNEVLADTVTRIIHVALNTVVRTFLVIFILVVFFTFGPGFETKYLGTMHSWRAANFVVNDRGNWTYDVYGIKPWYRANCKYIRSSSLTAVAFSTDGKPAIFGQMRSTRRIPLLNPERPASTLEQGFGNWEFISNIRPPVGAIISTNIRHRCHWLWETTTHVQPLKIQLDGPLIELPKELQGPPFS